MDMTPNGKAIRTPDAIKRVPIACKPIYSDTPMMSTTPAARRNRICSC